MDRRLRAIETEVTTEGQAQHIDPLREESLHTAASAEDVDLLGALADRVIAGETIPDDELLTLVSPINARYRAWREERLA